MYTHKHIYIYTHTHTYTDINDSTQSNSSLPIIFIHASSSYLHIYVHTHIYIYIHILTCLLGRSSCERSFGSIIFIHVIIIFYSEILCFFPHTNGFCQMQRTSKKASLATICGTWPKYAYNPHTYIDINDETQFARRQFSPNNLPVLPATATHPSQLAMNGDRVFPCQPCAWLRAWLCVW